MNCEAVGMAVRVLGTAILRELVVDLPKSVVVYGRTLDTRELQWLVEGMGASRTASLAERGPNGETYEVSGVIIGRLVKLQLPEDRYADLNAARRLAGVR